MIWASLGMAALGAISSYNQQAGAASFSKAQTRWNNMMNLRRARQQGMALDTNLVRARTEATVALQAIDNSSKEAAAQAKVAQAAAGLGKGSADTILNSFAKKANQAEGNTMQQLVAELVTNKMQRDEVGIAATAGQSVDTAARPSAFGAIAGGVANYFTQTYGLKGAWSLGGGSSTAPSAGSQDVSSSFSFSNIDFLK